MEETTLDVGSFHENPLSMKFEDLMALTGADLGEFNDRQIDLLKRRLETMKERFEELIEKDLEKKEMRKEEISDLGNDIACLVAKISEVDAELKRREAECIDRFASRTGGE